MMHQDIICLYKYIMKKLFYYLPIAYIIYNKNNIHKKQRLLSEEQTNKNLKNILLESNQIIIMI